MMYCLTGGVYRNVCFLFFRWSRSTCPEGCVGTTEREAPSGTTWLVLWIPKVCFCRPPNRTSSRPRSDTRRCCGRSVTGSLRRWLSSFSSSPLILLSLPTFAKFFFSVTVGKEHRSHHSHLWLRGTRVEAYLEACYWDLRRGVWTMSVFQSPLEKSLCLLECKHPSLPPPRSSPCLKITIQRG